MTITDFTALTIRLPMLDRATLSQAWRDALHTTQLRTNESVAGPVSVSTRAGMGAAGARSTCHARSPRGAASPTSRTAPLRPPVFVPAAQRMEAAARSRCVGALGRRATAKAVSREQFSVTLANGERLCVLVASGRHGLIVTLLCAVHLQDEMRRALARLAMGLASPAVQVRVVGAMEGSPWRA
jgi:hypothetical protein